MSISPSAFFFEETRINVAGDREYLGYWGDGVNDVLTVNESTGHITSRGCKLALRVRKVVVREDLTDPVYTGEVMIVSTASLIEHLPPKRKNAAAA